MRLLSWLLTIACGLGALSVHSAGGFAGAREVALGLAALALLACPLIWAREGGLLPEPLAIPGRHRLMLGLALLLAAPVLLPWPLWL